MFNELFKNMKNLYLCGITSNEEEKISDLIDSTKAFFDGYVWCVDSNSNSDSTYNLLDSNKGKGKIVRHPWVNAHDWQANEWLYSGIFEEGDWCFIADSSEKPTEEWCKNMKSMILGFEKDGIEAVYCSGRPFLFKWNPYLFFFLTPHWSLQGLNGKAATIPEDKKKNFIINKRDLNPAKHYQEHDTKYYLYGRSNQSEAFYSKYGQEIVQHHEVLRREFRKNLINRGFEPSIKGITEFFQKGEFTEFDKNMIEFEFCLSEFYQRVILGMDFMKEIASRRYKWSFSGFLKTGDGFSDPSYEGTILKYNKKYLSL
jgi:hypothetical protein